MHLGTHSLTAGYALALFALSLPSQSADASPPTFAPEFYAFHNGVSSGPLDEETAMIKALGFAGIGQVHGGETPLATRVAAYKQAGLKVLSVYLNVNDTPIPAAQVKALENSNAIIELTVRKRSDHTVKAVREAVEMAAQLKIRVALYPHHGFDVATMPQALALIETVDHPNLGVMFNLCHFLKGEKQDDLERSLQKAGPHLFGVSISGADTNGQNWKTLIQPLDKGTFPQIRVLRELKRLEYKGPVSLQCYGIKGDKKKNLSRSIDAWTRLLDTLEND